MAYQVNDRDRDIAIRTMLGEAQGEGDTGMGAVAHVLLNRTRDKRWGNSVADVALQPKQFSTWNEGAGGNSIPRSVSPDEERYQQAGRIFDQVVSGQMEDPTGGATHYFAPAGMEALVAEGSQSNKLPMWLEEERKRAGGITTIGGHMFTGKASTPGTGPAFTGGSEIETSPIGEAMRGSTENVYNRDQGFQRVEGGQPNVRMSAKENSQGPVPEGEKANAFRRILGEDFNNWMTPDRGEALLAIGSGLLSGDNWAEGFQGAGQGLLALNQQRRDEEYRQDGMDLKRQRLKMAQQKANAPDDKGFGSMGNYPVGTVETMDGQQIGGISFDKATGTYFRMGQDGKPQVVDVRRELNNSDAYGSDGQISGKQAIQQSQELVNRGNQLHKFDRVYKKLNDVDYGVEGFVNEMQTFVDTLRQKGLDPSQMDRKTLQGELQGLVGASREAVVGGGVMTEQDAARVVMALGGDMQSLKSNPEVARELISQIRKEELNTYNQQYDQYEAIRKNYPNLPYVQVDRYITPDGIYDSDGTALPRSDKGALDSSNTSDNTPSYDDVEDILKKYE